MATNSFLYGSGVFTTVAVAAGKPFQFAKHWRRLTENAEKLEIDLSDYSEESVQNALVDAIHQNRLYDGRTRITLADENPSEIWKSTGRKKTSLSIITAPRRVITGHFKLTVSPHRVNTTSPLVGIKSCNYLEHLLSFNEAKNRGFDEAIRLNERGEIASACMANVFWSKNERLFTPSLKTGCLAGTTREFVLGNLECEEVEAEVQDLNNADAIFLTSAGIGIAQAAVLDERILPEIAHAMPLTLPEG